MHFIEKNIGKWFEDTSDVKILTAINIDNVRNLYRFSTIAAFIEATSLLLFTLMNRGAPHFQQTFLRVMCCIVMCVTVSITSKRMNIKYKKTGAHSCDMAAALPAVFYLLLSLWAIYVDVDHYRNGEQMLTYYIVQFCFLCFTALKPKIGSFVISLSFLSFYVCLYNIDRASSVQPINFFIFIIIAVLGNAIKYTLLLKSAQNKMEILELNQILQQEANIDDLRQYRTTV